MQKPCALRFKQLADGVVKAMCDRKLLAAARQLRGQTRQRKIREDDIVDNRRKRAVRNL